MRQTNEPGIRERILQCAVRIFSENGFHGTAMRDIAAAAKCSLPMLYYYYESKEKLYWEIAYHQYTALIERLNSEITRGGKLEETYTQAIFQLKKLDGYDKAVYKLALSAWLGFEGNAELRNTMIEWEQGRLERTIKLSLVKYEQNESLNMFATVLVRIMENMIQKIIFFDEDVTDEEIRREIRFLFNAVIL